MLLEIPNPLTEDEIKVERGGNKFSDPKKFDGNIASGKYCFVVHSFFSPRDKTPENLSRYSELSCSVIDQDKRATVGYGGYIIDFPPENLKRVYYTDLKITSMWNGKERMLIPEIHKYQSDFSKKVPIYDTPGQLLGKTDPVAHNEILIEGSSEAGKIQAKGLFILVDEKGNPLDMETFDKIQKLANTYHLPVVNILYPRRPKTSSEIFREKIDGMGIKQGIFDILSR